MGIVLKVTPEILKAKAAEIESDAAVLENEFHNIQDMMSKSAGYWNGAAGEKARNIFGAQDEYIQNIMKYLRLYPGKLLAMAGIYEETERKNAELQKKLPTDHIV